MFNSFFYKKLTTKKPPSAGLVDSPVILPFSRIDTGLLLLPRPDWNVHDTVQKWTAKFDLFEKKFVVVPINEQYVTTPLFVLVL